MALEETIQRFSGVLESLDLNVMKQASFMESLYNEKPLENLEQQRQTSLLERLVGIQSEELKVLKEARERAQGQDRLSDIPSNSTSPTDENKPVTFGGAVGADIIGDAVIGALGAISLGGIIKTAALAIAAPFAFSFVKGFLNEFGNVGAMGTIGTIIAGYLGLKIGTAALKGVVKESLDKKTVAGKFARKMLGRGIIGGIIATAGGVLGSYISDATGSKEFGDSVSTVANAVGLASLFGPQAAFIVGLGAAAYELAEAADRAIANRLEKEKNKALKELDDKIADLGKEGGAQSSSGSGEKFFDFLGLGMGTEFEKLRQASTKMDFTEAFFGINPGYLMGLDQTQYTEEAYEAQQKAKSQILKIAEALKEKQLIAAHPNAFGSDPQLLSDLRNLYSFLKEEKIITPAESKEIDPFILNSVPGVMPRGRRQKIRNEDQAMAMPVPQGGSYIEKLGSVAQSIPSAEVERIREIQGLTPLAQKTEALSQGSTQMAASPAPVVLAPGGSNVNAPQTTNNVNNTSITYNSNPAGSLSRRNARAE